MKLEEFASKIVDRYDIEQLEDTAVMGILLNWKKYPENLKEEIEQRQDILQGEKVE
jgi:hypothetical protein